MSGTRTRVANGQHAHFRLGKSVKTQWQHYQLVKRKLSRF